MSEEITFGGEIPSLEEVKDSLPAELMAQRKALEAHVQAWFLERQQHTDEAIRLYKVLEGLLAYIDDMSERTAGQPKEMLPDKRIGVARAALGESP